MSEETKNLVSVQINYRDVQQTFSAPPGEAWHLLCKFFNEFIPQYEISHRLWLNTDIQQLAKACEGLIAFSQEGASVLVPKGKLTDNETLLLWLLASYIGYRIGILSIDCLSKSELQMKLGKNGKITGTRLGELVKSGMATKLADEKFKLTVFGAVQMQKEVIPRIKAKAATL
ncbi:MAG: hypothetical protein QXU99_01625 [Candidatus Bathyarchaeia archaeon]